MDLVVADFEAVHPGHAAAERRRERLVAVTDPEDGDVAFERLADVVDERGYPGLLPVDRCARPGDDVQRLRDDLTASA